MKKRRISVISMVVTITAIALFQAYWIRKNYVEENRLLDLRTHLLFRETLFKLQASKLHLDTSHIKLRITPDEMGMVSTVNIVRERVSMDSSKKKAPEEIMITMRSDSGDHPSGDHPSFKSDREVFFGKKGPERVATFLSTMDSLQPPPTDKEIRDRFTQVLAQEGIHTAFTIRTTPVDKRKNHPFPDRDDGDVILGMANPVAYSVQVENIFWLVARRLGPQLLFSLALVGFTTLSFLLLYRNWRQQQKLIVLKNDFISNITHELKTPIATVSVAVEALKEFDALKDPVRTREYLEISSHELQRLSLLVDKVLKLSLFEKQEIELRKDEFDLKVLVEDIMASMRLQFEKYNATINFQSEDEKLHLRADKLHFTSVVYNLLDNALKYSKAAPRVTVHLQGEQEFVVLSVSDNGIGIPASYKDKIFEKFFRVPTGDQHNVKGYGLGLSYVAYVVQRHGGEVIVRSEEGVGSHFTIKIPRGYV
ncbi:MAG TPA: HAMP domain-containing sensor histidine kinase [Puia sp.]